MPNGGHGGGRMNYGGWNSMGGKLRGVENPRSAAEMDRGLSSTHDSNYYKKDRLQAYRDGELDAVDGQEALSKLRDQLEK